VREQQGQAADVALRVCGGAEGWYTLVISPSHSFGVITGYFPERTTKVRPAPACHMQWLR
jgi:hypothetical protein